MPSLAPKSALAFASRFALCRPLLLSASSAHALKTEASSEMSSFSMADATAPSSAVFWIRGELYGPPCASAAHTCVTKGRTHELARAKTFSPACVQTQQKGWAYRAEGDSSPCSARDARACPQGALSVPVFNS
eukprot:63375-Pleurochrysis_carterae.AAC.1